MKTSHVPVTLAGAFGAGALIVYFADPHRGKRRRAALRDTFVHSGHELQKFAGRFRRDLENRVAGVLAEGHHLFEDAPVSDEILEQRIHTMSGRVVSHPGALEINCAGGSVFLGGWVLADEVEELIHSVRSVRGVKELSTFLNTTDHPERVPALQAGARRAEDFQNAWSPTLRVLAGFAGAGLMVYGAIRRQAIGKAVAVNGGILLARSVLNTPMRRIIGTDPSLGIVVQKTISIHATPQELYEFWRNPENYSKVFAHVKHVAPEKDGYFRWQVPGPGGVPLSWTGTITRQVPNRLIEWWSTPESSVANHGIIRLEAEPDGKTRVQVRMSYSPPAGLAGHAFASLLGFDPKTVLDEDFVRLKSLFELGKTRAHGHEVKKEVLRSSAEGTDQVA